MNLEKLFTYHPATEEQKADYAAIRKAALALAEQIVNRTPVGPDQSVAIRKVREAVMVANAAIATDNAAAER